MTVAELVCSSTHFSSVSGLIPGCFPKKKLDHQWPESCLGSPVETRGSEFIQLTHRDQTGILRVSQDDSTTATVWCEATADSTTETCDWQINEWSNVIFIWTVAHGTSVSQKKMFKCYFNYADRNIWIHYRHTHTSCGYCFFWTEHTVTLHHSPFK